MNKRIKALVMDVDGTLTDGGIYVGAGGECMKRFYVRDGMGIKHILPAYHILPIVITGRESQIVVQRCIELNISELVQGSENKWGDLCEILYRYGISPEETAYIGDDINDLECMKQVGLAACPRDAADEVKAISTFVSQKDGGYGAVRELIDWIVSE